MYFEEALNIGVECGWKTIGEVLRNIKTEQVFKDNKTGDKLRKLNAEWKTVMINSLFTSNSLTKEVRQWLNKTEVAFEDV